MTAGLTISPVALDRLVLDALREAGSLTTSEVAYEVGVDLAAAERSLARLVAGLKVRDSFGAFTAREV